MDKYESEDFAKSTPGYEIHVIRASRVLDPVLRVSKKENRRFVEISAKLVNFV